MTIRLDLRKLTDDKIAEAMRHFGDCYYSSPCIIGVLIPWDKRGRLDEFDDCAIDVLCGLGEVKFPNKKQVALAKALQAAFDTHNEPELRRQLNEVRALSERNRRDVG